MIDYKKLEMVHNLAPKVDRPITIQLTWTKEDPYYRLIFDDLEEHCFEDFEDEDGLISKINQLLLEQKLIELKAENSRWKIGDTAWMVDGRGKIFTFLISKVHMKSDRKEPWFYESQEGWIAKEENIYTSRKALVEAQIEYWREQSKSLLTEHYSVIG